jgi:hypothetical protein
VASIIQSREMREVGVALEVLSDSSQALEETRPHLSEDDRALAEHYLARVGDLQQVFQFAQLVLELLVTHGGPPPIEGIVPSQSTSSEE